MSLKFLHQYRKDIIFSQNGEEGIILECVRRMEDAFLTNKGHAVEIGGNDGRYCSNTALLLQQYGWTGLFVEADYGLYLKSKQNWAHMPEVRHQCCKVDEHNINAFVHDDCTLLSLDTDGSDYRIFRGLQSHPAIVIVEIDSSIPPLSNSFNRDGAAGYYAMTVAALERGYFVLCHTGNLVLVRDEFKHLFPDVKGHPLIDYELYFNPQWLT